MYGSSANQGRRLSVKEFPDREYFSRVSHNKRVLIALAFSFAFLLYVPMSMFLPPSLFSLSLSPFTISRSNKLTVYRLGEEKERDLYEYFQLFVSGTNFKRFRDSNFPIFSLFLPDFVCVCACVYIYE